MIEKCWCDKTYKIGSKTKHHHSQSHIGLEKCIILKHAMQNPNFLVIDEIFNEDITDHNKKFDSFVVR